MPLDKGAVTEALRHVQDPISGKDVVSAGVLLHAAGCDGFCSARLSAVGQAGFEALNSMAHQANQALEAAAARAGEKLVSLHVEFVNAAGKLVHQVRFGATPPGATPPGERGGSDAHTPIKGLSAEQGGVGGGAMPGIRHVIAVGAGKGGVGKSTVSINLAVGLARRGHAVGALDADIYGPSFPTMLGLHDLDQAVVGGNLQPFLVHGIKAITIGKLVEADKPLIWRGPMAHRAFEQLAQQTNWGELDELVIDLPPGTGDVSLTMAQKMKLTGAVVVCTPQRVAQDDAARAAAMFQQLGIEVLGVVENMSYFVGDDGKEYDLFGRGGARRMAERLGLPFLGEIPITTALRINSDAGNPSANFEGESRLTRALEQMVENVEREANLAAMRQGKSRPRLTVS